MKTATQYARIVLTATLAIFGGSSMAGAQAPIEAQLSGRQAAIAVDPAALQPAASELTVTAPDGSPTEASIAAPQVVSEPVIQAVPPQPGNLATRPGERSNDAFVIKRILPIDGPIKYGEWFWDDEGVPPGKLVVTVDLDARVISVFRNGYEIGAAAVLLGTEDHPTPLGTFPILTKERHNVSEKYDNAPMPWTLRLTWDGIAIHGGSEIQNGYASHGCISVPDPFAARLFDIARRGDKVVITRGKMIGLGDSII
ncbi:L,D-transpeptidase family protein [Altererythrobacter sp.]|uniref:L,D-transpeptidase family protein n=1 Tax=Altererythrobacter sp. TaxID=1872480 RepID=UPI003D0642F7